MNERDWILLKHLLDAIADIERYTKNVSWNKFSKTKMIQDAVIRNFEIMGEATKGLSKTFRLKHKELEWAKIAGMLDVLIYEYFGVQIEIVWDVIHKNLPDVKKQVKKYLKLKV